MRSIRVHSPETARYRFATSTSPMNFGAFFDELPASVVAGRAPPGADTVLRVFSEKALTASYMPLAIRSAVWPITAMDTTVLMAPALLLCRSSDSLSTGMRSMNTLNSSSDTTCFPRANPDAMADVRNESTAAASRQANHSGPPTSVAIGSCAIRWLILGSQAIRSAYD